MVSFYETFAFLCEEADITPSGVAREIGIPKSSITSWKKEGYSPRNETLNKIADFFGVSTDFLNDKTGIHNCAGCGFQYDRFNVESQKEHSHNHLLWLKAKNKFGFCWNFHQRERRHEKRKIAQDTTLQTSIRFNAYLEVIAAYFSRSLESSGYRLDHPTFPEYVALYMDNQHDDCPDDLREIIIKNYGTKPGMYGTYFFSNKSNEVGSVDPKPVDNATEKWLEENTYPVDSVVYLPIVGRVAAGNGVIAQEEIIGYEFVDADELCSGETYFWLRVNGDSMSPKIEDGDLVLVKQQPSVDSGSYAVVIIDGEDGVVKKVNYGADWIELVSINPYYPPRHFKGPDVLRITVVGKVLEVRRKL